MKQMSKEEFLHSRIGKELKDCIANLDEAKTKAKKCKAINDTTGFMIARDCAGACWEQWKIFQMVTHELTSLYYQFVRTDEYYGLATEDESDWLFKVNRES